jgi:hypothetical protein
MERERSYKPVEKTYFTEEEYQAFLTLKAQTSYLTPEMKAVVKKVENRNPAGFVVKPDRRIMRRERDMRSSVYIAPEAPNERYPRATDVSSHPHIVNKSDTGKLYYSDYFKPEKNEYDLSFVALQRRYDMTPQSPMIGESKAIHDSVRTQADIFAGTQLAFQGAIPDAYRNGFITLSQEYE